MTLKGIGRNEKSGDRKLCSVNNNRQTHYHTNLLNNNQPIDLNMRFPNYKAKREKG